MSDYPKVDTVYDPKATARTEGPQSLVHVVRLSDGLVVTSPLGFPVGLEDLLLTTLDPLIQQPPPQR